jgi:hypothetical protein
MHHDRSFGFATRSIHAGTPPDPTTGSRTMPIYQTAAYVFGTTEQAAELFQLRSYGHIYSRISNPTVAAFEERMASLEGGLGAIAFSSGLAAQLCTVLALAQAGDHLVSSQNILRRFTIMMRWKRRSARIPSCSLRKRSAIRRERSPIWTRSRNSRTSTASHWWSTTRLLRPISAGLSNTAPTSWSIRQRSLSAAMARQWAA